MHQSGTLDVGMAVHQASIAVASVANAHQAEVVSRGTIGTRPCALDPLLRRRQSTSPPLVFGYDASPCGAGLSRYLTHKGHGCWVVAPSLIPQKPGDRVNTNRRDAIPLARLMRAGDLTPVYVPTVADEAMRDLGRARAEALRALKTAKVRLKACLRRQDLRYPGRATWSPAHLRWLSEGVCPTSAPPLVFQAYVRAVTAPSERLARLEQERTAQVQTWRLAPVVEARQTRRGIPCTGAVTPVAELGDLTRFEPPRQLMNSLGFTPSASSTGARRRQGGRTQAGNTPARRALLEGAWASRAPANGSRHRQRRLEKVPKPIQDLSGKAPVRRCKRSRQLSARGQHPNHVVVAIARALRALMGAMAREVPLTP